MHLYVADFFRIPCAEFCQNLLSFVKDMTNILAHFFIFETVLW